VLQEIRARFLAETVAVGHVPRFCHSSVAAGGSTR
jgi:hypothetical protein